VVRGVPDRCCRPGMFVMVCDSATRLHCILLTGLGCCNILVGAQPFYKGLDV
jgi:hypothetical protein